MTSLLMNSLVKELNDKLGDRPFYTTRELISVGIFGSIPAAKMALRDGQLSFVKISPRRFVVPRAVLLEFLRNNLTEVSGHDRTQA